jgi:ribosomal protein S28E/S33/predicted XRE-type DNA-binding protein
MVSDETQEPESAPPEPSAEVAASGAVAIGPNGGIFDGGLAAYQSVTEEDYRWLLTAELVVFDASALLNLYRYHPTTRNDLLAILTKLKGRVWVAHHAMLEFFENRMTVIESHSKELDDIVASLSKSEADLQAAIKTWANRAGLPQQQLDELLEISKRSVAQIIDKLKRLGEDDAFKDADDAAKDPVIIELTSILDASIGAQLPESELLRAKEAAIRRIASKTPPGWKDANKSSNREGDYLVWYETLREAKRRGLDVLFITGDVKEDWWHKQRGEAKGPLPALVAEMKAEANVRLYMLRPASLLIHASRVLDLSVSEESVQDAERVSRSVAGPIRIGDVWDALGNIWDNGSASGFRPVKAQAALGTVYMEGPDSIVIRLPNRSFLDWGIASDELLTILAAWGVYPRASGKYPVPTDIDPTYVAQPHGSRHQ